MASRVLIRSWRSQPPQPMALQFCRYHSSSDDPMTFLLLSALTLTQTPSQWVLDSSTLRYHVSHPLHQVGGVSHAARGKGVCQARRCDFLIAVPIKSFDSGDSNRDLH